MTDIRYYGTEQIIEERGRTKMVTGQDKMGNILLSSPQGRFFLLFPKKIINMVNHDVYLDLSHKTLD